jgi:V/A-type H+-transporting ATPase subunit I
MAIVKMKHLRMVAMQSDRDAILHLLQRMGCVEIDEPQVDWSDPVWAGLARPGSEGLSSARERKTQGEQALSVLKQYAPQKDGLLHARPELTEQQLFDPEACAQAKQAVQSINDAQRQIAALKAQQTKLQGQKAALAPWLSLDIPLETQSTKDVAIHLGTVPATVDVTALEGELLARSELVQLTLASSDREYHYLLIVCHASVEEDVLEVLKDQSWSRANLRDQTGTAVENDRKIDQQLQQMEKQIQTLEQSIVAQGGLRDDILQDVDRASMDISREDARSHLLDTRCAFFLEGWLPAENWEETHRALDVYPCAFEAEDPTEEDIPNVPIKLKNNWFTRPLSMVTDMYSLPAYSGVDPNPLMAPFFILFYGMMMADMGYGLVMMIMAAVVIKKTKPNGPTMRHMMPLMFLCGVSTFIWGALTGGFFGDFLTQIVKLTTGGDFALPALFSPLDDAIPVLVGSLILGVLQVFTAMVVSMYKQIKRGETMAAICNEGAWFLVFLLAGLAAAGVLPFNVAIIAIVVVLVIGLSYGKKGIIGKIMGVFGGIYNGVTGYFSDILSYSRLMALMLAGAVVAQVFNQLGAMTGNVITFVIIAMIGNALNFALNLLGCYVHDMRLQCLEFFGRFYEDGGRAFTPLDRTTKYIDIIK